MKLLFDQNISFRIVSKLGKDFEGCVHVSECNLTNVGDSKIWDYAKKNGYAVVTFDSDFYDISIINGHPPKIIWIRSGNLTTSEIVDRLIQHRLTIHSFLSNEDFRDLSCLEID